MRAHVEAGAARHIGDGVLQSVREFADTAATQARKATGNLTRNAREHPIVWAAGASAIAAAVGILVARAAKHSFRV